MAKITITIETTSTEEASIIMAKLNGQTTTATQKKEFDRSKQTFTFEHSDSQPIGWGKHKDKTPNDLVKNEIGKSYLAWLYNNVEQLPYSKEFAIRSGFLKEDFKPETSERTFDQFDDDIPF